MLRLSINGSDRDIDADADAPLLWVLRDELKLTGTKYGCGIGACGACTVMVDGAAMPSCITTTADAVAKQVVTIEGLSGPIAEAVRDKWIAHEVAQCGYCQSGQIVAATALLSANRNPTDAEIDVAMEQNICRCCTYGRIREAIRSARERLRG